MFLLYVEHGHHCFFYMLCQTHWWWKYMQAAMSTYDTDNSMMIRIDQLQPLLEDIGVTLL